MVLPLLTPRYNIAPGQAVAIIAEPLPGARQILPATWGLPPRRGGGAGRPTLIFNARAETLLARVGFRRMLAGQRCLIPADGFYLWERVGRGKFPWLYGLRDAGLFAFAGLCDRWADTAGREVVACTIITTAANELVLPVHDRMPAILPRAAEAAWLDPGQAELAAVLPYLAPYPAGQMARIAVSMAVNSGRIDDAQLILPYAA
jgi:putative SOS response-associated peptidase YedK